MKNVIAMLLVAFLSILSCSACGSSNTLSDASEFQSTELSVLDKNKPSSDTLQISSESEHESSLRAAIEYSEDIYSTEMIATTEPKNESDMITDLQNNATFYSNLDAKIQELEIIKRQTNEDDKTDYVYVSVRATNEYIECNRTYKLDYTLYNEGWILDYVTPYEADRWDIAPLKGPDMWLGESAMYGYDNYTYLREDLDLENKSCTMYFSTVTQHTYAELEEEIAVFFIFNDSWEEWESVSVYAVEESITWDLAGYWYPTTPDSHASWRHYYLSVSDDDPNDNSVYVVVLDDRNDNIYFEDYVVLSSEGGELEFETHSTMNDTQFTDEHKMTINMDRGVCYGPLSILYMLDSYHNYERA